MINNKPDTSLGVLTFKLDLDTGAWAIDLSNKSTHYLTSPEELAACFPMAICGLLCEELKRRSKSKVVA
jgi:hypothetical protein